MRSSMHLLRRTTSQQRVFINTTSYSTAPLTSISHSRHFHSDKYNSDKLGANKFSSGNMESLKNMLASISNRVPFNFGTLPDEPRDFFKPPLAKWHVPFYRFFFDRSFDDKEFLEGCTLALRATRQMLVDGDLDSLKNVMTKESYQRMETWFKRLQAGDNISEEEFDRSLGKRKRKGDEEDENEEDAEEEEEAENIKEQLKDIFNKKMTLRGQVDQVDSAHIVQIKLNFLDPSFSKFHTDIIVRFYLKEDLAIVDEEDNVVLGTKHSEDRRALVMFHSEEINGPWKIKAFIE